MLHLDLASAGERSFIKCISKNTDTLTNKLEELEVFVHENSIDIVAISETLPKNTLEDKDNFVFNLPGFKCINKPEGRGICMFVNKQLDFVRLSDCEQTFNPSIFIKVLCENDNFFILGLIYRSDDQCSDIDNDNLNKQIELVCKKYHNEKVIITGDFNFPDIDWHHEHSNKGEGHKSSKFLKTIHENFLSQSVEEPTHHKPNSTPSLIDLILCNDPDFISDVSLFAPLGKSHHSILSFSIPMLKNVNIENITMKYQWSKGNYEQMRKDMDKIKWDDMYKGANDASDMINSLDTILTEAMDNFVPKKAYKHNHTKRTFTAPPSLLLKFKLKRSAFKYYKCFPTVHNFKEYVRLRNDVNADVKVAKREKEIRIAHDAKTNPKAFYQYVASKSKCKESVYNLFKEDGSLTTNDAEKAEVLSKFFSSVFTKENTDDPLPDFKANFTDILSSIKLTTEDIEKALNSLNVNKSPGPDNIHPRILKELSSQLSYPLLLIFNKTMEQGKLPHQWKEAEVRPIFKKGCKSTPGNYRPVSLTSILCKIFEGFVRDALYKHIVENNLLSAKQFGFCKGRSCVTQLLYTINKWMTCLDNHTPVDAIYLDFAKAFDTVPHKRLLSKLEGYGVQGNVFNWIKDFLTDRTQYVSVNGKKSVKMPVTSGVPQGSVLGPILFIYFINDLPLATEEDMTLFADDAKAFNEILVPKDRDDLQICIDALVQWSIKWGMGFNGCKCKVMHLGFYNPKYSYTISNGTTTIDLEETTCEKDLGVYVDNALTFDEHVNLSTKKARKSAGLLLRNITHKTPHILVPLFKSLVRPILEYANTVWSPYLRKHIDAIEKVQRNFTKRVFGMYEIEYCQRLEKLGLPSLEYRRVRGDLIETYKILQDIYDPITTKGLFTLNNTNFTKTRGHNFKLTKISPNLNIKKYFFTNRVVNLWNQLPGDVVNSSSVNVFKNRIDSLLQKYMYSINIEIYSMKI